MKALVTGANGLIGAHLCRDLLGRGVQVVGMVRANSNLQALDCVDAKLVTGDVLHNSEALSAAMRGCELVFHTAAHFAYTGYTAAELEHVAVHGTGNVLQAAASAGVRRVVITSSSVVFGSSIRPEIRDESALPNGEAADGFVEPPYVKAKVAQDRLAAALAKSLGIDVVFACPTMCVGAHATRLGPSNAIIVSYLSDPLRVTYRGGCNIVSARNVAAGHYQLAQQGASGEHYILGSENLSWQQIHQMIAELCGVEGPRTLINHTLAYCGAMVEEVRGALSGREPLTSRQQASMVGRYYWYSHAKAASLGFVAEPARAALAEACAWLAASSHISRGTRSTMLLHPDTHAARRRLRGGNALENI